MNENPADVKELIPEFYQSDPASMQRLEAEVRDETERKEGVGCGTAQLGQVGLGLP